MYMIKFIEIEDEHFNKMIINPEHIIRICDTRSGVRCQIELIGISTPITTKMSYREIKSLLSNQKMI